MHETIEDPGTFAGELEDSLEYFTGTQEYHALGFPFANVVLTDGAKYLAEKAGAWWLMDVIASHIPSIKNDYMAVAQLKVKGNEASFRLHDGDRGGGERTWARQRIPYTDFPLESIMLFVERDHASGWWVILLPSEH